MHTIICFPEMQFPPNIDTFAVCTELHPFLDAISWTDGHISILDELSQISHVATRNAVTYLG
jgi:hypothetical protein